MSLICNTCYIKYWILLENRKLKYFVHNKSYNFFTFSHLSSPLNLGFPGGSASKESACNAGDPSLIPGSGRSPEGRNGNPLQYSCLENPMDRGVWWATVHGIAKSWTQLSEHGHGADPPWPLLNLIIPAESIFTNKSHSQVLKIRTWTHLLGGGAMILLTSVTLAKY